MAALPSHLYKTDRETIDQVKDGHLGYILGKIKHSWVQGFSTKQY